jgi:very-short-patch-repair endonuclease
MFVTRHPRPVDSEVIDGIWVASAAETPLAAARDLSLLDLVVLGDSALHVHACTKEELWLAAAQRRRGAPRLRVAIPLLDGRSESAWESVLRLLHFAAEVDVEPQKQIYDEWGRFVARADLWLVGTHRIHEYDGGAHRDREAHRADLARERRLVEIDWQRIGFTSPQLLYEAASIIAGMDRLLGRTWSARRLAGWQAMLDDSLLRPRGRARAMRQWQRST